MISTKKRARCFSSPPRIAGERGFVPPPPKLENFPLVNDNMGGTALSPPPHSPIISEKLWDDRGRNLGACFPERKLIKIVRPYYFKIIRSYI